MIPGIREINFGPGTNAPYATLHQATVSFEEMGERTISTQVRIDGDVVPDFSGWELEFRGERFVLPTRKPQATKDNSTRNSLVDLVFTSLDIYELKRYFFAEMTEITAGTMIIDKYIASLRLSLSNFVDAFNRVLEYYFPDGDFVMNLNPSYAGSQEVKDFPIEYTYIWDVLTKFYEIYGVTWKAVKNNQGVTVIRVGYEEATIDDHIFQYGFDGGLLRFERHVEDTNIYNVLLGRGGEKNIPYRYFKDTDPYSPIWAADPDAIPELKSVYFSRLLDANFRRYVQGWRTNQNGILGAVDTYDAARAATDWAYEKGHTDTKFDPVEYVKDDESIAMYGVRQGKMDDADEIFPTIQGVWLDDIGRADEIVAVHVAEEGSEEAQDDIVIRLGDVYVDVAEANLSDKARAMALSAGFTIPEGRTGRLEYAWLEGPYQGDNPIFGEQDHAFGSIDTVNSKIYAIKSDTTYTLPYPAGEYITLMCDMWLNTVFGGGIPGQILYGRFGLGQVSIHCKHADGQSRRETFTIWVKNLWETTQGQDENDIEYTHRVWDPILGDKLGAEAAVSFSDGFMSISEDYTFFISKWPEVDRTKSITTEDEDGNTITVQSEWKITLLRSDAEYEATGLYIPNTQTGGLPLAGNHFFFTGVDLPIQYVRWAENRLTKKKEDALPESAQTNPTWVIGLDKVRAHTLQQDDFGTLLADRLDAGVKLTITDPRFTPGQALTLGVRSVTFSWDEPSDGNPYLVPDIEITLSEKIEVVRDYDAVKNEITQISNNYMSSSDVKSIIRTRSSSGLAMDGNICYLGTLIGTVVE